MNFFSVLSVSLVLAVTVFQTQAEEAVIKDAVIKETVIKDAVVEDDVAKDAVIKDSVIKEVVIEDAIAKNGATKEALVEDPSLKDAVIEEAIVDCLYQKPECICLDYEEPVCAVNGCTYGNECKRVCADAEFHHEGPCLEEEHHESNESEKTDSV